MDVYPLSRVPVLRYTTVDIGKGADDPRQHLPSGPVQLRAHHLQHTVWKLRIAGGILEAGSFLVNLRVMPTSCGALIVE